MNDGLLRFYLPHIDKFYQNNIIRSRILKYNEFLVKNIYKDKNKKKLFERIFIHYLEEAENTLIFLKKEKLFSKKTNLLEVGGGLGLVYGYLKTKGYKIYSLEPSLSGFDDFFNAGKNILHLLKIKTDNWLPLDVIEAQKLSKKFDLIFSHNVLEHIKKLSIAFKAMKAVLKPKGMMIHNTVNYFVPYEPHYKIPLLPFFPQLTSCFVSRLRTAEVWQGLNFINPIKLYLISKKEKLKIIYLPNQLAHAFERLDKDREYAFRHKKINQLYRLMKMLKIDKLIFKLPAILATPIAFKVYRR